MGTSHRQDTSMPTHKKNLRLTFIGIEGLNTNVMKWENIKENKCPKCGKKLRFRTRGSIIRIKANEGKKTANENDGLYFCSASGCIGFQISASKRDNIEKDQMKKEREQFKDNPLFKTGLLRY